MISCNLPGGGEHIQAEGLLIGEMRGLNGSRKRHCCRGITNRICEEERSEGPRFYICP